MDIIESIFLAAIGTLVGFFIGISDDKCKKKSINNVHFYVARDKSGELWLYMGKPIRFEKFFARGRGEILSSSDSFPKFGLNVHDFDNLKWKEEPVEVFINMEE